MHKLNSMDALYLEDKQAKDYNRMYIGDADGMDQRPTHNPGVVDGIDQHKYPSAVDGIESRKPESTWVLSDESIQVRN